jgi:ADP-ribosylglycohydrolase
MASCFWFTQGKSTMSAKVPQDEKPIGSEISLQSRVRGCLLGGAIGDALGAPVEFMRLAQIKERFGPNGIVDYAPAYGRIGAITDDTQMTLFTAEGLMRAFVRQNLKGICSVPSVVSHAYLRWLLTQGAPFPESGLEIGRDGWLWGVKGLHSRRAPGNTCLSALASMKHFTAEPARNDSKGAGAIMRVAPVALIVNQRGEHEAEMVYKLAKSVSWITHGHPSGYLSAAAFAVIVHALLWEHPLTAGIEGARRLLKGETESAETLGAIERAVACFEANEPPGFAIPLIGGAWVGEEALGVALYCALTTSDFASAVRMAVNHDGDSDTTGLLVGQLLGAMQGEDALPANWLRNLELRETIAEIADDLSTFLGWELDQDEESGGFTDRMWERYPGW